MGFMPLTGQAALDPKVRHEFGQVGALTKALNCMELLCTKYQAAASTLTAMRYNGGMLDIKPPEAKEVVIPERGGGTDSTPCWQQVDQQGGGVVQDWSHCCAELFWKGQSVLLRLNSW